jgi:hypothetical protein
MSRILAGVMLPFPLRRLIRPVSFSLAWAMHASVPVRTYLLAVFFFLLVLSGSP